MSEHSISIMFVKIKKKCVQSLCAIFNMILNVSSFQSERIPINFISKIKVKFFKPVLITIINL